MKIGTHIIKKEHSYYHIIKKELIKKEQSPPLFLPSITVITIDDVVFWISDLYP